MASTKKPAARKAASGSESASSLRKSLAGGGSASAGRKADSRGGWALSGRKAGSSSGKKAPGSKRRRKTAQPKSLKFVRIAGLLVLLAFLFGGIRFWDWYRDNRLGGFKGDSEVYVQKGTTPDEVITQIKSQGGIRWERSLRKVFRQKRVAQYIKPGHYSVRASYSNVYLARMLNNSWQSPVKLSLSPSLRLKGDIARSVSAQLQLDSVEVAKALGSKTFLRKYGVAPTTVYSLFLPDTYEVWWDCTADDLFGKLRLEYDIFWNGERKAKAKSLDLSPEQVNTLASIVCRESNHTEEYPKIAGVYLNRLRKGMKLQADPTVAFCFDYKLKRILNKHLQVDSRYNTYRYAGLPPGPICPPSKAAIDAVLNADTASGNLYFCASAKLDGTHVFSKDYSQHRKNSEAFRKAAYGNQK